MDSLEKKIAQRNNAFKENPDIVGDSLPESNFAWKAVKRYLPPAGGTLLDVGSGKGRFSRKLADLGFRVTGVDLAEDIVAIAKQKSPDIAFQVASATAIPFPDNSFDVVLCISVLEQIPDTEKAIAEMARVLKPGGRMLVLGKNKLGLHPRYLIPVWFWITFLGEKNKWQLFPRDFEFQEKYFIPWRTNKLFKKYCRSSQVHYIRYDTEDKQYPMLKGALIAVRTVVVRALHALFPFLDYYFIWEATK